MEGFEPLLQFAYTSKLLFTKENIHAIHSSAEFLGFHNLESACFDFLIPKFYEGKNTSNDVKSRVCCRGLVSSTSFGSNIEGSQPKTFDPHSTVPSVDDGQTDSALECAQSVHSPMNSEEEHFCLDNCGPQMPPLSLELTANAVCPVLSSPCPDSNKAGHSSQFCERDILEIGHVCNQSELSLANCGLPCELSRSGDVNPQEVTEPERRDVTQTIETLGAETNCNPSSCPLGASGTEDCSELLKQSETGLQERIEGDLSDTTLTPLSNEEGFGDRSSVEREVAEHLAKGFWSDLCPPQIRPPLLDHMDQNSLAKASDFHWLKQLDLSSNVADCPFLRDFETSDDPTARTDSLSQSEKSPYMSSPLNSGDDSDLDTDGDTEANNKRAAEVIALHS